MVARARSARRLRSRRRGGRKAALLAAAGAASAAVALSVILVTGGSPGPTSAAAAERWSSAAAEAFTAWADRVPIISQDVQQWQAGALSTPAFVVQVDQTADVVDRMQAAALKLPPYPGIPDVDAMYRSAAQLYVLANRLLAASTGMAAGALRDQTVLSYERVREIGDRTFDQGRVLTSGGLSPAHVPAGTTVHLPAEVPDWTAEGLAAGPPLASSPPPPGIGYPPLRQGPRPTEARSKWILSVRDLGVTSGVNLSDGSGLLSQADALEKDAVAVAALPDPAVAHGREASDRLRLSLLVQAEACRVARAGVLAGGSAPSGAQLRTVAADLLTAARTLAVPGLP